MSESYQRFLELLTEKGERVADVSKATGISPATFSDWKAGRSTPKLEKLIQLAEYFGVDVEYLSGQSCVRNKPPFTDDMLRYGEQLYDQELKEAWETITKALKISDLTPREKRMLDSFRLLPSDMQDRLLDLTEATVKNTLANT
jgi:transcriptional regulator with XRE-family HTH domain